MLLPALERFLKRTQADFCNIACFRIAKILVQPNTRQAYFLHCFACCQHLSLSLDHLGLCHIVAHNKPIESVIVGDA